MEVFSDWDWFTIFKYVGWFFMGFVGTFLQILDKAQQSNIPDTFSSLAKYYREHQVTIFRALIFYVVTFIAMCSLDEMTTFGAFLTGYATQDFWNTRGMKGKDYHKVGQNGNGG